MWHTKGNKNNRKEGCCIHPSTLEVEVFCNDLDKTMQKKEIETVQEVENTKKTSPVKLTDASILLNSGKMGFVFIGVIVGFVVLTLLMSFIKVPSIVYVVLLLLSLPFVYVYYLHLHANDEDKLD